MGGNPDIPEGGPPMSIMSGLEDRLSSSASLPEGRAGNSECKPLSLFSHLLSFSWRRFSRAFSAASSSPQSTFPGFADGEGICADLRFMRTLRRPCSGGGPEEAAGTKDGVMPKMIVMGHATAEEGLEIGPLRLERTADSNGGYQISADAARVGKSRI